MRGNYGKCTEMGLFLEDNIIIEGGGEGEGGVDHGEYIVVALLHV